MLIGESAHPQPLNRVWVGLDLLNRIGNLEERDTPYGNDGPVKLIKRRKIGGRKNDLTYLLNGVIRLN